MGKCLHKIGKLTVKTDFLMLYCCKGIDFRQFESG